LIVSIILFALPLFAYDGPVGVTFRAPLIQNAQVSLAQMSVQSEIVRDAAWKNPKDRAFPIDFIATKANTTIELTLVNSGDSNIRTRLLVPYDASATLGTGFTIPSSFEATLNGKPLKMEKGPQFRKGDSMLAVRSYLADIEIEARSKAIVKIRTVHSLAVNPWYSFVFRDDRQLFKGFNELLGDGSQVQFEISSNDRSIKDGRSGVRFALQGGEYEGQQLKISDMTKRFFAEKIRPAEIRKITISWPQS
jgi:hypothetical protein